MTQPAIRSIISSIQSWLHSKLVGQSKHGNSKLTRLCMDRWNYLEITPAYGLKPCCKKPPLTFWSPGGPSLESLREDPAFHKLRGELTSGSLSEACEKCHIRPLVPVQQFRKTLRRKFRRWDDSTLLNAQPLCDLRLEITTDCNLRCVYCASSQPGYTATSMSPDSFDDIIELVRMQPKGLNIYINGHGETTSHKNWVQLCTALIDIGFKLGITTNLAKKLTDEEATCLARFRCIQVSLDTVDATQLMLLRRSVKLPTITANIEKIRAASRARKEREPLFEISCGVYDANYAGLEDVATFCIRHNIFRVTFWQLVKYPDLPNATNVYPIPSLDDDRIEEALSHMERTLALLHKAGIKTEVAGEFLDEWRKLLATDNKGRNV